MPLENQNQNENTQNRDQQNDQSRGSGTQDQNQRSGTLLNDGSGDQNRQQQQQQSTWGDDWRVRMAGGDAERAKALDRFADPTKVFESYRSLQQKVGSGELRSTAPRPSGDAATPEAVKAWKSTQGLPAEPTEIKFPLPAGAKMEDLDDAGRARVEHFTKAFYEADIPQGAIDKIMGEYNAYAEQEANARAVADGKLRDQLEDTLRSEWGADYRTNIALTDRFMQTAFGEEVADAIMGARTADGQRLFNMPGFFKAITQLARQGGVDDVVTGETQIGGGKTVDQRLDEIREVMRRDMREYRQKGLDKEYETLLQRKEGRAA